MSIAEYLSRATKTLKAANIATARLDSLVLLEDALNKSRTHLLAHLEIDLSTRQMKLLEAKLARRSLHEPLAYIRGKTEFYGREFTITPAVLEPRPESETMIELLLKQASVGIPAGARIADVGTGCGALGITAKLELPNASVDLLEVDESAIEIAKLNVIKFATSISVIKSDLLQNTSQNYDILLCNLPYVPDDFHINPAAMREPKIAIFGGADGLDLYRKFFNEINNLQHKPLLILCESLPPQQPKLCSIAQQAGYHPQNTVDFIQAFIPA